MQMNEFRQIVAQHWQWLAAHHPYVTLDKWIVMPNHLHGILVVTDASRQGGSRTAPTIHDTQPPTFSSIDDRSPTSFTA
jgi:putative transposase